MPTCPRCHVAIGSINQINRLYALNAYSQRGHTYGDLGRRRMASCFHGDTRTFRGKPLGSAGHPHIRAFGTQNLPSKGCDCGHQHTHTNIFTYLGTIVCCIPHDIVGDATLMRPLATTGTLLPGFHSSRPGYHPRPGYRDGSTSHPWPRVWPARDDHHSTPGITTAANVPSLGLGASK